MDGKTAVKTLFDKVDQIANHELYADICQEIRWSHWVVHYGLNAPTSLIAPYKWQVVNGKCVERQWDYDDSSRIPEELLKKPVTKWAMTAATAEKMRGKGQRGKDLAYRINLFAGSVLKRHEASSTDIKPLLFVSYHADTKCHGHYGNHHHILVGIPMGSIWENWNGYKKTVGEKMKPMKFHRSSLKTNVLHTILYMLFGPDPKSRSFMGCNNDKLLTIFRKMCNTIRTMDVQDRAPLHTQPSMIAAGEEGPIQLDTAPKFNFVFTADLEKEEETRKRKHAVLEDLCEDCT